MKGKCSLCRMDTEHKNTEVCGSCLFVIEGKPLLVEPDRRDKSREATEEHQERFRKSGARYVTTNRWDGAYNLWGGR